MKKENILNKDDIENKKQNFLNLSIIPQLKEIQIQNEEKINYISDCYIINEDIYNLISESSLSNHLKSFKNNKSFFIYDGGIVLLDNTQSNNFQILIGVLSVDNLFIPEILVNYEEKEENKNYMFDTVDLLEKINDLKYNSNIREQFIQLNDNNNCKIINLNINNNTKSNIYLQLLVNLYINKKNLIFKFSQLNNEKCKFEKYFLVQKDWMKLLLDFYYFDEFKQQIKDNNIKMDLGIYNSEHKQFDFLMKEINQKISKDFINKLNNIKENENEKYNYLKNIENFECKLENFEDGDNKIYYYDNYEIINESIFNIIREVFNFDIEGQEIYIFIVNSKLIFKLILNKKITQYSLIFISFENFFIKKERLFDNLINYKEEKYMNNYLDNNYFNTLRKSYLLKSIKDLNFENDKYEIYDSFNNIIGIVYKNNFIKSKLINNEKKEEKKK